MFHVLIAAITAIAINATLDLAFDTPMLLRWLIAVGGAVLLSQAVARFTRKRDRQSGQRE